MNERSLIILKLITTHLLPAVVLCLLSFFTNVNILPLLLLTEALLILTFLTGYWEFFGQGFRWYYLVFIQVLIIFRLIYHSGSIELSEFNIWPMLSWYSQPE